MCAKDNDSDSDVLNDASSTDSSIAANSYPYTDTSPSNGQSSMSDRLVSFTGGSDHTEGEDQEEQDYEEDQEADDGFTDSQTTVMLRNLPSHFTRDSLIDLLEREGFAACFDFVYLPMHFSNAQHFGYAFINLVDAQQTRRFWRHFDGFVMVAANGDEQQTHINWSVIQGLDDNINHYRNSQLMHAEVNEALRPVLYHHGTRAEFPPPTKPLRKPRSRQLKQQPEHR